MSKMKKMDKMKKKRLVKNNPNRTPGKKRCIKNVLLNRNDDLAMASPTTSKKSASLNLHSQRPISTPPV